MAIDLTEVDSLETLRQPMIALRDEALKQADFESAVMLSHVIAWMSWAIENNVAFKIA